MVMTKIFLDTNIFLEYFEQRREHRAVSRLLSAVEDGATIVMLIPQT